MTRTALIATLALGLSATALPAAAQTAYYAPQDAAAPVVSGIVIESRRRDGEEMVSKTVSYADLDVSSHAGARVLFQRIRSAAEDICGPDSGWSGEVHDDPKAMGCTERALTLALYRAHIPALTYVYQSGRR